MYCVYLTIYGGDLLPPYYIGSTSLKRYHGGYYGSVSSKKYKSIWKGELSSHPELFDIIILSTHETRQEAIDEEYRLQLHNNVVRSNLFINQAYACKNGFCDGHPYPHSDESRSKMSKSARGRVSPNKGRPCTEEQKRKQSEKMKGRPSSFKGKTLSPEAREKISQGQKAYAQSPEYVCHLPNFTGYKQSPEHIEKRIAAIKAKNKKPS